MGANNACGVVSDSALKETYKLSFTRVMSAITQHYARLCGVNVSDVSVMYQQSRMYILVKGKLHEVASRSGIDDIFNSLDVKDLRRKLKKI